MARSSSRKAVLEAYKRLGSKAAVARELGLAHSTVSEHCSRAGVDRKEAGGRVHVFDYEERSVPKRGRVNRYIVTSAQNNTGLHKRLWANLNALAKHYDAEMLVSRYTYNRNAYGKGEVKPGHEAPEGEGLWYAPEIAAHVCDSRVKLAPDLMFAGELNILPTATRPLSGLETYTGPYSMIVPHAKLSLQSVPSMGDTPAKLCYTTGSVTLRNYIAKKAGQQAEFHHAYAALLVEVDSDGDWFVRQLNASEDGTIYDCRLQVKDGAITPGDWVESATWGDIHVAQLERNVRKSIWGHGGLCDQLRPKKQFFHDLHDHRYRNHHDTGNAHKMFRYFVEGTENVEREITEAAEFLCEASRPWSQSYVVASNHDGALARWLREANYKDDPVNAIFFLAAQLATYTAIRDRTSKFCLMEWALQRAGCPSSTRFLRTDESCTVKGIEHGMHGHLGPNGYKGSPQALVRMGSKANMGHSHSAGILDGLYIAGVTGRLRMGYNSGPSSWSRSHIITYTNGKRTIITQRGEKWTAQSGRSTRVRTGRPTNTETTQKAS